MNSRYKLWLSEVIGEVDESEEQLEGTLLPIQRDSSDLNVGVRQRRVNSCSCCEKSFPHAGPGVLFDGGESVCFDCIPTWWAHRSPGLSVVERESIERKLVDWLRKLHRAEIVTKQEKLTESRQQSFRIVAVCDRCRGVGTRKCQRCHYCDGRGTIWVVTRKKIAEGTKGKVFSAVRFLNHR